MHPINKGILIAAIGARAMLAAGPSAADEQDSSAAYLFAYTPKPGMTEQFNEGYRQHLAWHRQNDDSLVWYAWYVVFGDRLGMFVDGTFGLTGAEFDQRIKPAEDGADFARTSAPFVDTVYRRSFVLRADLGDVTPLENRAPTPLMQVVEYTVHPGREKAFEAVIAALRQARLRDGQESGASGMTWYETVIGGAHSGYLLTIGADNWQQIGERGRSIASQIRTRFPAAAADRLSTQWAEAVTAVHTEVWTYRSDLSYFPPR